MPEFDGQPTMAWRRRFRTFALLPPCLAAALVLSAGPVLAHAIDENQQVTYFEPGPDYLVGYLAWKNGQHSVVWDPGFDSDAGGGPSGGGTTEQTFTIRSAPTPFGFFVNVSRFIQLTWYVEPGSGGPSYDIALRIDGEVLAGSVFSHVCPVPLGGSHNVLCFSMRSEFAYVPKDSVIEIQYVATSAGRYLVEGERRSEIRVPLYPPHEVASRKPMLGPNESPGGTGEESDSMNPPFLGILGVLAPLSLVARRSRPAALCLLLFFAGCLGDGVDKASPPQTSSSFAGRVAANMEFDGTNATGLVNSTTGGMVGRVADRDGFPIKSVSVSILRTSFFKQTDAGGNFRFAFLPPGAYTLRAEHLAFGAIEKPLEIREMTVTRIDVVLTAPDDVGEGDFRRHPHDSWGARTEIPVFETDVYFHTNYATPFCCAGNVFSYAPYEGQTDVAACSNLASGRPCGETFILPTEDPENPILIKPGTAEVEVVVTWPSDLSTGRVGIGFVANDEDESYNWSFMYPRGNGKPTHIRTSQDLTDVGHQVYSTWRFMVYVEAAEVQLLQNPLHVSVTIHKGFVPLEPPHRDFWDGKQSQIVLADRFHNRSQASFSNYPLVEWNWRPQRLIPPGTEWIEIEMKPDSAGVPAYDWDLLYKPADSGPQPYGDYSRFIRAEPVAEQDLTKLYRIRLNATETDAFYAKSTSWEFGLDDGQETQSAEGQEFKPANVAGQPISIGLKIVAHRDEVSPT